MADCSSRGGSFGTMIANSIETLRYAFPKSVAIDFATEKLEAELALLKRDPPSSVSQLMGSRRGRLLMVSPDSLGTACPLSGRNSTYRPVQISGAGSSCWPWRTLGHERHY